MRTLIVAMAALAVSGCNSVLPSFSQTQAAVPTPLPGKAPDTGGHFWTTRCISDRFTDQASCSLGAFLRTQNNATPIATIISMDAGRSWAVNTNPPARAVRLRVDNRPAMTIPCEEQSGICNLDPATSTALTAQLRVGRRVAFEAQLPTGPLDADFSAVGFTQALNAARTGKSLD